MRNDVYVENDSGAMSILSSSVVDRVVEDARGNDSQFVEAHEAILGLLVGDDSFIARVVVGEPLTQDEQDQWIAHYRWALNVPCGKLLVAGGFDPDILQWWKDGTQEMGRRGVKDVAVSPGKYLVDVYTYLHSMNGRVICDDIWQVKLGAWFRKDHAGRAYPSWVAGELVNFNEFDPGHEQEWKNIKASVDSGAIKVETSPLDWISFLVHLQPFDPQARLDEQEEGDWFSAGQNIRQPKTFPLGVPAVGAEDPEYRYPLEPLLPPKPKVEEPPPPPVEVFSHMASFPLKPVAGGTVDVPAAKLDRVFRLAWFCTGLASPELKVEGPGATELARHFTSPMVTVAEGDALRIQFPGDGTRFGTLKRVGKIGAGPWRDAQPGTVLEMAIRPEAFGGEADPNIGAHRYRGTLRIERGEPVWAIGETYPAVSTDVLRRALALSAAAEAEDKLRLTSEEEARQVFERFNRNWKFMLAPANTLRHEGADLILGKPDDWLVAFVGLAGFRAVFGSVWPHEVEEEGEEED